MDTSKKTIAVVIPVYQSVNQLANTVSELINVLENSTELKDLNYKLNKVILVDDGSIDGSHKVISELSINPVITSISLNRNYGQHAAIFAGVLASNEDVIITMDEDGEHDPLIIPKMIRKIEQDQFEIVYAKFKYKKTDLKELSSVYAKKFIGSISRDPNIKYISSFRAVKGAVFRSAAVYANNG